MVGYIAKRGDEVPGRDATRESIIAWLEWNDRGNGVYTDADCDAEGWPRLTLETARSLLREVLGRD